jgi:hypothetical protein
MGGAASPAVLPRVGFETWQALKTGVATCQRPQNGPRRRPSLHARIRSFKITILYGEPPFYAHVTRDGATLILRHVDEPAFDAARREREELLSAEACVNTAEEIKALFLEFQAAGVTFFQTLKLMPWGARNFIVKDPDGNLVLFAGPGS